VDNEEAVVHGAQAVVWLVAELRSANFERRRVGCSNWSRAEGIERHFVATARTLLVHWIVKNRVGERSGRDRDEFEGRKRGPKDQKVGRIVEQKLCLLDL
jgi:hypothetical protein